jgi:hypothetical protein
VSGRARAIRRRHAASPSFVGFRLSPEVILLRRDCALSMTLSEQCSTTPPGTPITESRAIMDDTKQDSVQCAICEPIRQRRRHAGVPRSHSANATMPAETGL